MTPDPEKCAIIRAHMPKHLRTLAHSVEKLDPRNPEGFANAKMQIMRMLEALATIDERLS